MLVNVNIKRDLGLEQMLALIGQGGRPVNVSDGIYISPSFSFGNDIQNKHQDYPEFDGSYEYSPYGVCDEIEQVLTRYDKFLNDPDKKYCVSFTKISKSEQSESGGWRWHKWGEYIGTKTPQCEYLYDEGEDITEVYCYHIYEILS